MYLTLYIHIFTEKDFLISLDIPSQVKVPTHLCGVHSVLLENRGRACSLHPKIEGPRALGRRSFCRLEQEILVGPSDHRDRVLVIILMSLSASQNAWMILAFKNRFKRLHSS